VRVVEVGGKEGRVKFGEGGRLRVGKGGRVKGGGKRRKG
jgi:hypothetical protein